MSTSTASSPFAAMCPALDDSDSISLEVPPTSTSYEPPTWMSFWQSHLRWGVGGDGENTLITDWMKNENPTEYAVSVVSLWLAVTAFLLLYMLLAFWIVPMCVKRRQTRKQRDASMTNIPPPQSQNDIRTVSNMAIDNRMLPYESSSEDSQEEQNDDIPQLRHAESLPQDESTSPPQSEYPSQMSSSQLHLEQRHLEQSMMSALSVEGVEDNEASDTRNAVHQQQQERTTTSLHYLQYCNTPSSKMKTLQNAAAESSSDNDSSIDLLESSSGSMSISSSKTDPPGQSPFQTKSPQQPPGQSPFSKSTPRRNEPSQQNNDDPNNATNVTTTFEDVLRNVYLDDYSSNDEPLLLVDDDDHEEHGHSALLVDHDDMGNEHDYMDLLPSVSSLERDIEAHENGMDRDEVDTTKDKSLAYPMPGVASSAHANHHQEAVGELSTIAPSLSNSFDTTTSIPIMDEQNFLFFQDDDDESREDEAKLHPQQPFSVPAQLPATSSLTRKVNEAAATAKIADEDTTNENPPPPPTSSMSSRLKYRKRLLEEYVSSLRNAGTVAAIPPSGDDNHGNENDCHHRLAVLQPSGDDNHGNENEGKETPDTSPTSTIGRDLDLSKEDNFIFQDEHSSEGGSVGIDPIISSNSPLSQDEQDETQSNIAVVETTNSNNGRVDKRVNFAASNASTRSQSIHRPRASSQKSKSRCDWLPPMMVLFASTVLIVSAILFGMNGVWVLHESTQNAEAAWDALMGYFTKQVPSSLDELQELQQTVMIQTWNIWQSLDTSCPKLKGKRCDGAEFNQPSLEGIDAFWNTEDNIQCQLNGLPLSALWEEWSAAAQPLQMQKMTSDQNVILQAQDAAIDFWQILDANIEDKYELVWDWTLYVALGANVLLAFVSFGVMWMIAVPSQDSRHPPQNRMQVPFCWCSARAFSITFWTLFVLAWAFGLWFSVGTVLTVDTCGSSDTPNAIALELMDRWVLDHPSSTPLMDHWTQALQQCSNDGIIDTSNGASISQNAWLSLMEPTHQLSKALEALPPNIYFDICGAAHFPMRNAVDRLSEQLCALVGAWEVEFSTQDGSTCGGASAWYPDYASIMFDSVCEQGSKALLWVTATQTLILCMAMLIWTFRASFLPESVKKKDDSDDERKGCCRRRCCAFSWPRWGRSQQWHLSKNNSSYSQHSSTGSSSGNEQQQRHENEEHPQQSPMMVSF